eukprot:2372131-Rhodomonas_salina.1
MFGADVKGELQPGPRSDDRSDFKQEEQCVAAPSAARWRKLPGQLPQWARHSGPADQPDSAHSPASVVRRADPRILLEAAGLGVEPDRGWRSAADVDRLGAILSSVGG